MCYCFGVVAFLLVIIQLIVFDVTKLGKKEQLLDKSIVKWI